jgi:uncharacterized protein YndB with AHSA1/START domain
MTPMTTDAVMVSVQVEASQQRAFDVFTDKFGSWWPMDHHIGSAPAVDAIIEPRVGGRWFERAADGTECEWGTVLEWEAPARIVLGWQLDPQFVYDSDPSLATQVEVRFIAEGPSTTRVELEHRGFDVHGERGAAMRNAVSSPGGWGGIMQCFAEAAA